MNVSALPPCPTIKRDPRWRYFAFPTPVRLIEVARIRRVRPEKMALPLKPGLLPSEVAFLCEMELIIVIPRQRLAGLELLGVSRPV